MFCGNALCFLVTFFLRYGTLILASVLVGELKVFGITYIIYDTEHSIKKNGSFSFEEEELHVDVVKDAKQRMYLKVNERVCSAGGNGRPETRRSEYFYPFSGSLQEATKENWKQYAILSERLYSLCEWS